jgi:hypothetical protein
MGAWIAPGMRHARRTNHLLASGVIACCPPTRARSLQEPDPCAERRLMDYFSWFGQDGEKNAPSDSHDLASFERLESGASGEPLCEVCGWTT